MARQSAKANIKNMDEEYAFAALIIEKELGANLTPNYPALKFVEQLNQLGEYRKREKIEMERSKTGGAHTLR
jgi:hypothetical protein